MGSFKNNVTTLIKYYCTESKNKPEVLVQKGVFSLASFSPRSCDPVLWNIRKVPAESRLGHRSGFPWKFPLFSRSFFPKAHVFVWIMKAKSNSLITSILLLKHICPPAPSMSLCTLPVEKLMQPAGCWPQVFVVVQLEEVLQPLTKQGKHRIQNTCTNIFAFKQTNNGR